VIILIKFEKVTKKFGNTEVLKNINIEILSKKITMVIGSSGSGKTTFLKMINRLIEPSEGKIYVDGEDISKLDLIELRRSIGYVIQQIGLFPHLTVEENIELVPTLKKWPKSKKLERTKELMQLVGLPPEKYLNRYPKELSGGQQQRVGVARALAINPNIILMDEAFSAVDAITRAQLQSELRELQQKLNKTIVFVTHDINEALKIGDMICVMDNGTIVQYDTVEEILKNPANEYVEKLVNKEDIYIKNQYVSVKDIMIKNPITITPLIEITQVIEIMRENNIDNVFVVDDKNHLLGTLTAEDILLNNQKSNKVEEIYKRGEPISVKENDSILDVLNFMSRYNLRNVPVVDGENIIIGLITWNIIVTHLNK
jgi:osmoprotectant transport system ATP-binding protein